MHLNFKEILKSPMVQLKIYIFPTIKAPLKELLLNNNKLISHLPTQHLLHFKALHSSDFITAAASHTIIVLPFLEESRAFHIV